MQMPVASFFLQRPMLTAASTDKAPEDVGLISGYVCANVCRTSILKNVNPCCLQFKVYYTSHTSQVILPLLQSSLVTCWIIVNSES